MPSPVLSPEPSPDLAPRRSLEAPRAPVQVEIITGNMQAGSKAGMLMVYKLFNKSLAKASLGQC